MARKPAVTVRMYKGLLGDCFLLRLRSGDKVSHILIDCGILQHIPGDKQKMQAVARDIQAATGGRLDLLVVTHEHHDHISGFAHAREVFLEGGLAIDNLWMAWTEDDADPKARALNARFDRVKLALGLAMDRAQGLAASVPGADQVLGGLENFIGPMGAETGGLAATGRLTGKMVMAELKKTAAKVSFLEPGETHPTPGAVSLKAHVLGPPRNETRLFQDLPSHGSGQETYVDRFNAADQLLSAAPGAWERGKPERPFAPRHGLEVALVDPGGPSDTAAAQLAAPTEKAVAMASDEDIAWLRQVYYAAPPWRRVDAEWLGAAGPLALKLDSDTNNTSLVLAFEAPGGEVLLFAADAQVGNWLSWHDQKYEGVEAADLLARTVFYKVGHHASHNATLEGQGLELMAGKGLTAMIPVVETDARAQGSSGWNMPYPPLLERLMAKTEGRVLRGDMPTNEAAFKRGRVRTGPNDLYVEYDVLA